MLSFSYNRSVFCVNFISCFRILNPIEDYQTIGTNYITKESGQNLCDSCHIVNDVILQIAFFIHHG